MRASPRAPGTSASWRTRSSRTRATLPAESPPAPDLAGASLEERAAFSLHAERDQLRLGLVPDAAQGAGDVGLPHRRGGAARARAVDRGRARRDDAARRSPRPSARTREHELMGHFAVHLRELGERRPRRARRLVPRARPQRRRLGHPPRGAARELADVARRLGLRGRAGAVLQARADRGRRPRARRHRARGRPGRADAVRRQPRAARAAARRRARVRRPTWSRGSSPSSCSQHDSPEEVEIRACALHAVELLVAAHGATTATAVDNVLWHRGGEPRYKAVPRHRARTTDY